MYNNINRNLLYKYKKYLNDKLTDLKVKSVGSYWTHYQWTDNDQADWDRISMKLRILNNRYSIY